MNKKRLLGIILSIVLVLWLTPVVCMTARADEPTDYHLNIGGVQVTSANKSGTGWSFTPGTSNSPAILSLTGATITSSNSAAIKYDSDAEYPLKIEFSGDNTISGDSTSYKHGIENGSKDIIIAGSGKLTVSGHYGIYSLGSVTISGGEVITSSTGNGDNYGICTENGDVIISGGAVTATGYRDGICAKEGSVTIGGAETIVNASGTDPSTPSSHSNGIYSYNNITINGGVVNASAGGCGLNSFKSDITISGGKVTVNVNRTGIYTLNGTVSITGGIVEVICTGDGSSGMFSYHIDVSGGSVEVSGKKYGVGSSSNYTTINTISISGGCFIAKGGTKALNSKVKNAIKGTGWSNTEGTQDETDIEISDQERQFDHKKVQFLSPTVTVPPKANTLTYNEEAQDLVTDGTAYGNYIMEYAFGDDETNEPASDWDEGIPQKINVGTYYVWYRAKDNTSNEHSVSKCVPVTIGKASATVITPPTSSGPLTYTGQPQALLATAGTADENGTMEYAIGVNETNAPDSGWSTGIPEGTDAKTYYVWYRATANNTDKYKDSTPVCVTATIKSKPAPTPPTPVTPSAVIKTAPVAKTLTYSEQPQELVTAGEAKGGTMQYALGKSESNIPTSGWSESIPTGTEAGDYFVWYKAKGDSSHTNSTPKCVTATIEKVPSTVTIEPTVEIKTLIQSKKPQELITAGEATGGTMQYAVGTDPTTAPTDGWITEIPKVTDPGTYYIWYKVVGDNNHEDTEPSYAGATTIIENHSDNVLAIDFEKGIATVKDDVSGGTTEIPLYIITEGLTYRMYNPNSGEHFYTKDPEEAELLVQLGWIHESGSDFTVVSATEEDAVPVYRLYNPNCGGMHFYTSDVEEAKYLKSIGWNYEGISHYVYKATSTKGTPQHRLYNPNSPSAEHLWTSDEAEVYMLINAGWIYEGICWRIV